MGKATGKGGPSTRRPGTIGTAHARRGDVIGRTVTGIRVVR